MIETISVTLKGRSGLLSCSKDLFKIVREHFSIKNPNYMARRFSPRLYAITPGGAFLPGMWFEIENYLKSLNLILKFELSDEFSKVLLPKFEYSDIEKLPSFEYRDYQEETIKEMLDNGRGIALLATGAGKTGIIGGACKTLIKNNPNIKILITTPTTTLLNQLYDDFVLKFKIDEISKWGDSNKLDLSKNIVVVNSQMLTYDLEYSVKIFKNFDVVIVDEVHTLGDKKTKIGKFIHNIDTPNKFGLTGTLPTKNMIDVWTILGKIGPILFEKNSYEVRQMGNISEVEVRVVVCNHKNPPKFTKDTPSPTELYDKELQYIINNSNRNNIIRDICSNLVVDSNILIVVDRVDHGNNLLDEISKVNKKVFFVSGETSTDDRKKLFAYMESNTGVVCIAMSKIFSTGVSIDNLHYCIFGLIGKSSIKVVQTIGRVVRKHPSKNLAIVFDIADNLPYSRKHVAERIKIYKDQKIEYTIKNIKI